MSFSSTVWNRADRRTSADELSERGYIAALAFFTCLGLVVSSIIAYTAMPWQPTIWDVLVVGLAIPIAGILVAFKSDNAIVSLVGYIMVVCGLGAIIGPTVNFYSSGVVMNALMATAGVTIVMSIVGVVFPTLLLSWGGYLFGGLIALLFVRMGQMFMAGFGISNEIYDWPFIDYAAALLFTFYIVYDWNRALQLPRTWDNAVDSAVAIYLDIANLFLQILKIMGRSSGSSSSSK